MEDSLCIKQKSSILQQVKWKLQSVSWFLSSKLSSVCLSILIWQARDSNYIKHAKREFDIMYKDLPKEELDGPNTWIKDNIIELLAVLSTQGHSGGSIGYCLSRFKMAAQLNPLTQIEDIPESWGDEPISITSSGTKVWQSRRMSSLFKNERVDGSIYYNDINSVIYQEEGSDYYFGRGNSEANENRVTMPYYPAERPRLIIVPASQVNK